MSLCTQLVEVRLNTEPVTLTPPTIIESRPVQPEKESLFVMEPGITIAIVIASVGGGCCIALIILQVRLVFNVISALLQ